MTLLSDQFSAVRKAQFDFFDSMTTQAIENAGRLAALNLAVSRDVAQRSLGAGFALLNSRDPREVLGLGDQAQEQMRSLFAYGRELLGIAGSVRAPALAPQAAVPTVQAAEQSVAVPAAAATVHAATPAAPAVDGPVLVAEPEAAPAPLAAVAEPVPGAEPKAIAKAAGKGAPRAAAAPHPAAAPVTPADLAEAPRVELNAHSTKRKK